MLIGENIRQLRIKKGLSQEYMAEKLGISQQSYSRIEIKAVNTALSRLKEIAEILEVHLFTILEPELSKEMDLLKKGERNIYLELLGNMQKIIDKQEDTIRNISGFLVFNTKPQL